MHRSKTCVLQYANDVDQEVVVALKRMRNRREFEREITSRMEHDLGDCVVAVRGWHTPAGEPFVLETRRAAAEGGGGGGGGEASSSSAEGGGGAGGDARRGSAVAASVLPGRGSAVQGQQAEATKASDDYPYVMQLGLFFF